MYSNGDSSSASFIPNFMALESRVQIIQNVFVNYSQKCIHSHKSK